MGRLHWWPSWRPWGSCLDGCADSATVFAPTTDDVLRTLQGHTLLRWAIVTLFVTAGVQLLAALVQRLVRWPRWSTRAAGAVVLAAVCVVVFGGSGAFLQRHGGSQWVKDKAHALVTDAETEQDGNVAARLFIVTSSGRIPLWKEAVRQSRFARTAGTGAGTFPFTNYRFRTSHVVVQHAHNQWLNVLSELGVVGLALFAVVIVLLVAAMVGNPFSRRDDPLHPLLVALQVGVIAFLVHMSWDWDWDMAAIGMLAFVFIAAVTSYRTTRAADLRRSVRWARHAARRQESEADAEQVAAAAGTESAAAPVAHVELAEAAAGTAESSVALVDEADEDAGDGAGSSTLRAWRRSTRRPRSPPWRARRRCPKPRPTRSIPKGPRAGSTRRTRPARGPMRRSRAASVAGAAGGVRAGASASWPAPRWCCSPCAGCRRISRSGPRTPPSPRPATVAWPPDSPRREGRRRWTRSPSARCSPRRRSCSSWGRTAPPWRSSRLAVRLQPQNFEVWFALGELQQSALGQKRQARASFTRALALNPMDSASRYELDRLGQ